MAPCPLILLSGCSGGGKSTLLAELRRRGYAVVDEPGRRIVHEQKESGGRALPWVDLEAVREARRWVFFDRGVVDAASALEVLTGEPVLETLANN